ncbi:MAG: helix-turn-helix transcriptional regulator, partial [Clostridiales bacterium]|nr:helix-turn-helix transcriptional regulator [Clostridiales bacterium]
MKFLIVTSNLPHLRQIQGWVSKLTSTPDFLVEWDLVKAGEMLWKNQADVLICEAQGNESPVFAFLANICEREERPEVLVLLEKPGTEVLSWLPELPSVYFLLFPVEEEKTKHILTMIINRVKKKRQEAAMAAHNQYWERHKGLIQQQFWMRLCSGQISVNTSNFVVEARNCGIDMSLTDTYQIAVLSRKLIHQRNTDIERTTRKELLAFANEWFQKQEVDFFLLEQVRPILIVRNLSNDEFLFLCRGLIREIQHEKGIPLCIYYDAEIYCEKIFQAVLAVMETERESMEDEPGIYPAIRNRSRNKTEMYVLLPEHSEDFLKNGQFDQFEENIRIFLSGQSAKGMISRDYLKAMRADINQLFCSVLKEKSIPAHKVLMSPELKELEVNAHISVEDFLAWVSTAVACMPRLDAPASVTEAVKTYVKEHIRENLSREIVANALYMNVDYLGKIYKRETGQSIGNCIVEEKMREAGNMLANTPPPIGEIGQELGYENFSPFSKFCKKFMGCTPRE